MFVAVAATWIALAALLFTTHATMTRPRGIAFAVTIVLALVVQWIVFLWAWFRGADIGSSAARGQTRMWLRTVFLLAFGIVVVYMSWNMSRLLLHV